MIDTTKGIRKGYVTFADILGWKGKWREKEMAEAVSTLIDIEKEIKKSIRKAENEQIIELSKGVLSKYFGDEGYNYSEYHKFLYDLKSTKYFEIEKKISSTKAKIDELYKNNDERLKKANEYLAKLESDTKTGESQENKDEIKKIIEESKASLDQADELSKKSVFAYEELYAEQVRYQKEFEEDFFNVRINLDIKLISDTFILTSHGKDPKLEAYYHTKILQQLIGLCLKNEMLVRGATSYGEYYGMDMVFIGPAIDDAASWHELGEEIGVFFTPKALLSTDENNLQICLDERIINHAQPKLKGIRLNSYIINWSSNYDDFIQIIKKYDTISPEISSKILNSKKRSEELLKEIKR